MIYDPSQQSAPSGSLPKKINGKAHGRVIVIVEKNPFHQGIAYAHMQDYAKAIADYGRALHLDPEDAAAYYNRGIAYAHMQDYAKAIADYGRAIDLDPEDAAAYLNTACAYSLMGNPEQACAWLERAIALDEAYREKARTDSDFDPIRDEPCFQALVGEGD